MRKHDGESAPGSVDGATFCDTCGMGYAAPMGRVCGDRSRFYLEGCKGTLVSSLPRTTRIVLNAFRDLQAGLAKGGMTLPQTTSAHAYTHLYLGTKAVRLTVIEQPESTRNGWAK